MKCQEHQEKADEECLSCTTWALEDAVDRCIELRTELNAALLQNGEWKLLVGSLIQRLHDLRLHQKSIQFCEESTCKAVLLRLSEKPKRESIRDTAARLGMKTGNQDPHEPGPYPEEGAIEKREVSPLKCDDCGATTPDVKETTCPYNAEINEKTVEITVCGKCYQERLYDI